VIGAAVKVMRIATGEEDEDLGCELIKGVRITALLDRLVGAGKELRWY
jgi:hypothetical protein